MLPRQTEQGSRPQQQQQSQDLHAEGPDATVRHGLQGPGAGPQAIGRIHGPIEVEPPVSNTARASARATWAPSGSQPAVSHQKSP